ncbi:MAG: hypothetical protein JKY36_08005 [Erythrobacter sp.]|nr:hypothetical protein [Erythrobacter sp.]
MLEQLQTARGAHFYRRRKRVTNKAIYELFVQLRREALNAGQALFRIERARRGDARYSAICFAHDRPVPFLGGETMDRVHGFLLLVEQGETIALFKAGLDVTSAFKRTFLEPLGRSRIERAIARHDAVFEKLSLRNMTTSPFALRSKILEARDLQNAIATSSATRFIPQGYRVRREDGSYSATPSTGRITVRADRGSCQEAVDWARQIFDLLDDEACETSPFIRTFARSIELSQLSAAVRPTYFAVDTMGLAETIFEADDPVRLVRENETGWQQLSKGEVDAIILDLDRTYDIVIEGSEIRLEYDGTDAGTLRFNKSRIALKRLAVPAIERVFVERTGYALGTDPDRVPLTRYLDAQDLITVLFSDLALAYVNGSLFRDDAMVGGGTEFLRHLQPREELAAATDEKGAFVDGQAEFDADSVFGIVADGLVADDILICDDLGDEWADFIGVSTLTAPPMVSFYHAKHGAQSLSASAFHEAVGQGIKNLGSLSLSSERMATKYASWDDVYRKDGAVTAIRRYMRGGTRNQIEQSIAATVGAPDIVRRVFIVTSSLSRADVADGFARAASGQSVRPNFVQLYWILMGFFSACAEVGAIGYVVCRP